MSPTSGSTDSNGRFTSTYTSGDTGTFTITASVSKSGFASKSGNAQVTVTGIPVTWMYAGGAIVLIVVLVVIYYFFIRSEKMWSSSVGVVAAVLVALTLRNATSMLREIPDSVTDPTALTFFTWVTLGILVTILSIMVVHRLRIRYSDCFAGADQG